MNPSAQCVSPLIDDPSADDELATRVRLFLGTQRFAALRRLDIGAQNGSVAVDGAVESFYERQLAIACVRRVAGVRQIIDRIVVAEEFHVPAHAPSFRVVFTKHG